MFKEDETMLEYLSILWELVINLIETWIFYFYINNILTPKNIKHIKLLQFALLTVRFSGITICNMLGVTPIFTIAWGSLFNALFAMKVFREKNVVCFFWGALDMLLGIIAELISYALLALFTSMLPQEMLFGETFRFPATTLYIICSAALSFLISHNRKKSTLFSRRQKVFVFFTMFIGIIMTHCFMFIIINLEATNSDLVDIIVLANFVFLCFFIFLLVYIYQLAHSQYENEELQEKARLLSLEENQYNNLLSSTESLREIKHDIHHHLSSIQALIKNDETQKLSDYLEEYETHFNLDYTAVSTGNLVVDSILATKMYIAKQQHTNLTVTVLLPDAFPFSDVALSALLGNLFDNALEACRKLPESQNRFINFQMKAQENMLLIHIENSFDGIVKKTSNHKFLTRKETPDHGIGLKRVQTLVEEADGFIEIRYDKNVFTVHIMVPLEEKDES